MQHASSDIAATLAGIPLFEGLAPALLREIARSAHVARFAKGALVYSSGDEARALFHVLAGQLKVAVSSSDGSEKVIDIVGPGQNIGIAEMFGHVPYVSFAEAVAPALVLQVPRDAIMRAIDRDPRVSQRLLRAIGERQSAIERDIASSSFKSGCRRVVDYLLRQVEADADGADTTVELGMPKHLLAARLGFTPETLSRAFRDLSEAGLISVRGRRVTLSQALILSADDDAVDAAIRQPVTARQPAALRRDARKSTWHETGLGQLAAA